MVCAQLYHEYKLFLLGFGSVIISEFCIEQICVRSQLKTQCYSDLNSRNTDVLVPVLACQDRVLRVLQVITVSRLARN